MEIELISWTVIAIVGTVGVLKNFFNVGGRRTWTAITLLVGTAIAIIAMYLPEKVLHVWVAVTGATLFYDTIFKTFQKMIEHISCRYIEKEGE